MQIALYIHSNHVFREYMATVENNRDKDIKGSEGVETVSITQLFLEEQIKQLPRFHCC